MTRPLIQKRPLALKAKHSVRRTAPDSSVVDACCGRDARSRVQLCKTLGCLSRRLFVIKRPNLEEVAAAKTNCPRLVIVWQRRSHRAYSIGSSAAWSGCVTAKPPSLPPPEGTPRSSYKWVKIRGGSWFPPRREGQRKTPSAARSHSVLGRSSSRQTSAVSLYLCVLRWQRHIVPSV